MKTLLLLSTKSNQYILQVMGTDILKYGASSDFVTIPKELYKNRVKKGSVFAVSKKKRRSFF
jgi:hypothetical protein